MIDSDTGGLSLTELVGSRTAAGCAITGAVPRKTIAATAMKFPELGSQARVVGHVALEPLVPLHAPDALVLSSGIYLVNTNVTQRELSERVYSSDRPLTVAVDGDVDGDLDLDVVAFSAEAQSAGDDIDVLSSEGLRIEPMASPGVGGAQVIGRF